MEIMMPLPVVGADLNFTSTCTSPMGSTPTSPHGGSDNYFFSAPTSPTSSSMFHRQISFAFFIPSTQNPIEWEDNILESPVNSEEEENLENHENSEELFTNRNNSREEGKDDEHHEDSQELFANSNNSEEEEGDIGMSFAFDFSGQLELTPSLPADVLFDGGKIKLLEPQPKKVLRNALSFRKKKKYSDPSVKTVTELRCDSNYRYGGRAHRERVYEFDPSSTRKQNESKALSPLRNSNMVSEQTLFSPLRNSKMVSEPTLALNDEHNSKQISPTLVTSSNSGSSWYEKWKLTNLLFRSASEGHQTSKKYDYSKNTQLENSSFRATERSGSGSYSGRKKERAPVHEWHYKSNRTTSGDLRRKTFLPYKQNLMGCMASDAVVLEPSGKRITRNSQPMMR